jgi:D-sedoheptulose 7-phosphate isomerase
VIDRHLIDLAVAIQHIDDDVPTLQSWGRATASAISAGGRLFVCGAGASAQQARHLVTELAGPEDDRPPLPVGTLEADVDRVRSDCRPGDVLLCLSATTDDEQVASAASAAAEAGITAWALTGPCPNTVEAACAEAVCVDAVAKTTIEEVHVAAIHIFGAAVNSAVRDAIR